jgi:hypothetical protein
MVAALKPDHDKGAVGIGAQTVSALGLGRLCCSIAQKKT